MSRYELSPAYCARNHAVFLAQTEDQVEIGITDATQEETKRFLEHYFRGKAVSYRKLEETEYTLNISRLFSGKADEEKIGGDEDSVNVGEIADDAPVINLLNSIVLEGLDKGASDIHIETQVSGSEVRYRIEGRLEKGMKLTSEQAAALSVRIKMLSHLNVLEKRRAQDGRFNVVSGGETLDIRLSIVPVLYGESMVLRILHTGEKRLSLEKLGFAEEELALLKEMLAHRAGLILVTGPTGAGKTTTLNAMLQYIQTDEKKIISIEDPVEYRMKGITQIQTEEETGMTFSELLRRVLRQDPDVIMIGEIRDGETAELAVRASLTGHLVLATLHTTRAAETPLRLCDMGVPRYLAASVLKGIVTQQLIPDESGRRRLVAEILAVTEELKALLYKDVTPPAIEEYMKLNNIPDFGRKGIWL